MRSRPQLDRFVSKRLLREVWGIHLLSPMNFSSPVLSPSCFTPTVQHFAGGWEDILVDGGVAVRKLKLSMEAEVVLIYAGAFNGEPGIGLCDL